MAALTVTAADVRPVKIIEQVTAPASVDLTAGQWVKVDANGKLAKADGATAAASRRAGILVNTCDAGMPGTFVRKGLVYLGAALDGLSIADPVYADDTPGDLGSAAPDSTATVIAGVIDAILIDPTTPLKVLAVDN